MAERAVACHRWEEAWEAIAGPKCLYMGERAFVSVLVASPQILRGKRGGRGLGCLEFEMGPGGDRQIPSAGGPLHLLGTRCEAKRLAARCHAASPSPELAFAPGPGAQAQLAQLAAQPWQQNLHRDHARVAVGPHGQCPAIWASMLCMLCLC